MALTFDKSFSENKLRRSTKDLFFFALNVVFIREVVTISIVRQTAAPRTAAIATKDNGRAHQYKDYF